MIYVATRPVCGIYTRVEEGQACECCACRVPYVLTPDQDPAGPMPQPAELNNGDQ